MLSGRGLCDGPITRPEEYYRLWCVVVCDLETSSRVRRPWPALGHRKKKNPYNEIGGACSAYGGEERRIQGFSGET